jgi:hypothetical protein
MRVLVVEDDPDLASAVALELDHAGYEVCVEHDAPGALRDGAQRARRRRDAAPGAARTRRLTKPARHSHRPLTARAYGRDDQRPTDGR